MKDEEKLRALDSKQAKIIAYIVVFGFMAIMLVFGLKSASQAPLHEGDTRRSITCKWCEGKGTLEGDRCRYCLGAKKLKAIIPGPNHPVRIRGTLWNLNAFESREEAQQAAEKTDYSQVLLKQLPETVGLAQLKFTRGQNTTEIATKPSGRYWGYLVPGDYTLTIDVPGYPSYEQSLTIPVREHPVWPKIPGVELEDEDEFKLEIFIGEPSNKPEE